MNKKQIFVIWLFLSILLPLAYLGGKTVLRYNREIDGAKIGFVPDPYEQQPREYRLRKEREALADTLGIVVFELASISGLVLYCFSTKSKVLDKGAILDTDI